jgi:hypothetical protein
VQQQLDELITAIIDQAQGHQRPQRIALLGSVRAAPATHHRHTRMAVRRRLRRDFHVPVVRLVQPGVENLLPQRAQCLVTRRIAEFGERAERPVRTLPLGVGGWRLRRVERRQQPPDDG